jgi:three-Cys-motif partner protein
MSNFFENQSPSSRTKAQIVAKYFPQYCKIISAKHKSEIRYLDLFAGPGKYEDGNLSTPLLLAGLCAKDSELSQKVRLLFNDKEYSTQLEVNFNEQFSEDSFKIKPRFGKEIVGESAAINQHLSKVNNSKVNPTPTLLFFDPWGYKGIDTIILSKFLANWANEIFLFVNVKRIHAATENQKFEDLMLSLFPTTIATIRKDRKYKATVQERVKLIVDNLEAEFRKAINGPLYYTAFKFLEEDSNATSHFIVHLTKHSKGYELVKQVYHDYDNIGATLEKDNVYTFDAKKMNLPYGSTLNFGDPNITTLAIQLHEEYKGKKLSARALFDEHQVKTKYSHTHYARALRQLVNKGALRASFSSKDNVSHKVSVLINDYCNLEFN